MCFQKAAETIYCTLLNIKKCFLEAETYPESAPVLNTGGPASGRRTLILHNIRFSPTPL